MSLKVILTENEILKIPNDYELGGHVRQKMCEISQDFKYGRGSDKNYETHPHKKSPWVCSICGESTEEIDGKYLQGYDHIKCKLMVDKNVEYDHCVICGKQSPYTRSTHIDYRIGYVEGSGQGCFQANICEK